METIRLTRAATVVLFDWLMEVDEEAIPHTHLGQIQALRDLTFALEASTFSGGWATVEASEAALEIEAAGARGEVE